uniref:Uncharacterized protein n=1 Tax=Aegilops tauschii TaxID=37682 RepID=R7VZC6_AEGTA
MTTYLLLRPTGTAADPLATRWSTLSLEPGFTSIIAQEEDLLGGEHLRSWCTSSRRLFSLIIFADIMASRCRIKAAATGRPLMTSFMKIAKIQQSGDSAVPPAPTSRMSVKHTIEVIQTFNEFKLIGHELMCLLFRHFAQPDCQADTENPYLRWRHPIEPDFSFITPVPRPEGWMILVWDMLQKVLNVTDPLYAKSSTNHPYKERDEALAWKLHNALLSCLGMNSIPDGQQPRKTGGSSMNPQPMTSSRPTRQVSAQCISNLEIDTSIQICSQHNISKIQRDSLHECLKLQGNFSQISKKALWKVLAPSDSFDD